MSLYINSIESLLDSIDDQLTLFENRTSNRFNNDLNSQRNYELNSNNNDNVRSRTNNISRSYNVNENIYGNLFNNINNMNIDYMDNLDNDEYNSSNGNRSNFDLTQAINDSFQETEYNYQGASISSNDSSVIVKTYKKIGIVGECNICCDESKEVCKCGICNFQYCQDCLKRVINDFNKCSSCGNQIDIKKLKKIDQENSQQESYQHNNILQSNQYSQITNYNTINKNITNKNTTNENTTNENTTNENITNENITKYNKKRNNKKNKGNNCPKGQNNKQFINFLFYKNKNRTIKVIYNENKRINKSRYTFEIKINNKNNFSKTFINFDTNVFNINDVSCFYNIITKEVIPWNHFIKLYENNLHIISNNLNKKNEFMTHIESFLD